MKFILREGKVYTLYYYLQEPKRVRLNNTGLKIWPDNFILM